MTRVNDTWRQFFSRLVFGTRWSVTQDKYMCFYCGTSFEVMRPVAINNDRATNRVLLERADYMPQCPKCSQELCLHVNEQGRAL